MMLFVIVCGLSSMSLQNANAFGSPDTNTTFFANVQEFVEDLKSNSESMFDLVSKVQALFCPDQPICGAEGVQDRNEVLRSLPTSVNVGKYFVELANMAEFAGVCCLSCSCSDYCEEIDNCCLTKRYLNSENNSTAQAKTRCIGAALGSYDNTHQYDLAIDNYLMVTDCFEDKADTDTYSKCLRPDKTIFDNTVPVTSRRTGQTYWNTHCAVCNNDANNLMRWQSKLNIKQSLSLFEFSRNLVGKTDSFEEMYQNILNMSGEKIQYIPPQEKEDNRCFPKDILLLYTTYEDEIGTADWLSDACKQFISPVYSITFRFRSYRNIFCFIAEAVIDRQKDQICDFGSETKDFSKQITALLDYKNEKLETNLKEAHSGRRCACDEIYDIYLKRCRPLLCPVGEQLMGCRCVQPVKLFSGMPVLLKLRIISETVEASPLTDSKLRKMGPVLKKTLQAVAEHTTVKIAWTSQRENGTHQKFLSFVVVRSDPGYDTKLTMKPFVRLLDTPRALLIKVHKQLFSVKLTTTVALSTITTSTLTVRAFDLQDPASTFSSIVYTKDSESMWLDIQPLSHLLYCRQVQLSDSECFENDGLLTINASATMVSDYFWTNSTHVRVCAHQYLYSSTRSMKALMELSCIVIIFCFVILKLRF